MSLPLVHMWCDGSGTVAKNPGGWAAILIFGERQKEIYGGALDATNNRMELMSVIKGFEALTRACEVVVHSDSEYVTKAYPYGWVEKWKAKGWRGVKNPDLRMAVDRMIERHVVRWEWVKGHDNVPLNERCDELAGDCRRSIIEAQRLGSDLRMLDFEIIDLDDTEQLSLA
jgi:ribonuclease HI